MGRAKDARKKQFNFQTSQLIELVDDNGRRYQVDLQKFQDIADRIFPPSSSKKSDESDKNPIAHNFTRPSQSQTPHQDDELPPPNHAQFCPDIIHTAEDQPQGNHFM